VTSVSAAFQPTTSVLTTAGQVQGIAWDAPLNASFRRATDKPYRPFDGTIDTSLPVFGSSSGVPEIGQAFLPT
jgi:hypothetical protein